MEYVLESKNIRFAYERQETLKGVSFAVKPGEYTVLTGENGSGKSTLLKVLLGELTPHEGEAQLFGTPVGQFKQWSKLGYLPQNGITQVLGFPANVMEIVMANLYSAIGLFRFPKKQHKEQVMEALELVDMADYAKRMPSQLSGGQLQRVLLAKALVAKPELLFLDEPTTAMDEESTKDFYKQLETLHQRGLSVFMITHDSEGVIPYADTILRLESGVLVPAHKGGHQ